jgi:hypothetical protein
LGQEKKKMSDDENAAQPTLWGPEDQSQITGNPTETAVIEAIRKLNDEKPLEGMQLALAQLCRSLARNIDGGNRKGRAIANETQQLDALLDKLAGIEPDEVDESNVPQATRELIDALRTSPRLDTPSASYKP